MHTRRRDHSWHGAIIGALLIIGAAPAPAAAPDQFILQRVQFEGGEALPQTGLNAIVAPFIGQPTTLADIEELRYRLTKHYVDQGYINSGVVIKPNQTLANGELVLHIRPGYLTAINVTEQGRLQPRYLTGRLQSIAGQPFNRNELQQRFQLLLRDPLIERLQGTLIPGATPDDASLDLIITRTRPWDFAVRTDNYRSPSSGAERAYALGTVRNLTGWGDALEVNIGRAYEGQGNEGVVTWSVPLTRRETRLTIRYEQNDSLLLEEPMAELAIGSDTQRFMVELSQPLWQDLARTVSVGIGLHHADNLTTVLDEPFSLSEGAVDGRQRVTALRGFQSYAYADTQLAYSLRSTVSVGVDAARATIHADNRPDGQFVTWLGQWQYAQRLSKHGTQLNFHGMVQVAGDRLLPLEHFTVGGMATVRGYRTNQVIGDHGYSATLELTHPVWSGIPFGTRQHVVQLTAFTDTGNAWRRGQSDERERALWSVGLGVLWTVDKRLQTELYYGHALTERPRQAEHNWQDDGLYGMIQVNF